MSLKGGVSFPLVLVVSIIVIAVVIAFLYVFIFQTKGSLEGSFEELTDDVGEFGCSTLGPVQGFICPNG